MPGSARLGGIRQHADSASGGGNVNESAWRVNYLYMAIDQGGVYVCTVRALQVKLSSAAKGGDNGAKEKGNEY